MSKQLLIDELATTLNVTKKSADETLETVAKAVIDLVLKGETITFPGLGKFTTAVQKGREGIAPSTGKPYKTEDKRVIKFTAIKQVRDAVAEVPVN